MNHRFETIEFDAFDGMKCNLKHLISDNISREPVLLVHGAGVRADIFNPPTENNLISMLAREGYDVWLENWRASIDLPPNHWNLDQAAQYDHPAAVKKVVQITGKKEIKAIIHCQGSTSFMISAVTGLVPEVKTIISNAVSLHPIVPKYAVVKLNFYLPVVKLLFDYLDPSWGLHAPDFKSKLLRLIVSISHQEEDTLVGKFVSFTYGAGFPALWLLKNLDRKTMDWIQNEFAKVPLSFFKQIRKGVNTGELVAADHDKTNVHTYVHGKPKTNARIVLFGGKQNLCFLPDSQIKTYSYLNADRPGFHGLHILDDYSHLDVFLGKNSSRDVFPIMIRELNQN